MITRILMTVALILPLLAGSAGSSTVTAGDILTPGGTTKYVQCLLLGSAPNPSTPSKFVPDNDVESPECAFCRPGIRCRAQEGWAGLSVEDCHLTLICLKTRDRKGFNWSALPKELRGGEN